MKQDFFQDESGAVTVDWVVLTGALVGLGLAVMGVVSSGVEDLSGDIDGQLREDHIIRSSFNFAETASAVLTITNGSFGATCSPPVPLPNGEKPCIAGYNVASADVEMTNGETYSYVHYNYGSFGTTEAWFDADGNQLGSNDTPNISSELVAQLPEAESVGGK